MKRKVSHAQGQMIKVNPEWGKILTVFFKGLSSHEI